MTDTTAVPECSKCAKTSNETGIKLKLCAKCHTTNYCSRECQKADWKIHKKICSSNAASNNAASNNTASNNAANPSATPSNAAGQRPKGLSVTIDKPFHRLDNKTWLHGLPEQDVYKLLVDTYRLRIEDAYNLEGEADVDSIYGGADDGQQGFRRFLRLAESRSGLLPSWWSREKAAACEAIGMQGGWSSLACAIEKSDVMEHYGNSLMPMQLRMFGEQVYGRGPGGQSGAAMRQMMTMTE